MRNPRPISELSASQVGSISWFISFGDLLTLLVCFFLLLTPQLADHRGQAQRKQGLTRIAQAGQMSGISLASRVLDVKGASSEVVPVWEHDLRDAESAGPSRGMQEGWLRLLVDKTSQGATATVQVCEAEFEREVLSETMEQLRVVTESASRVMFQVGTECDLWREQFASQQQLVAVVHFS